MGFKFIFSAHKSQSTIKTGQPAYPCMALLLHPNVLCSLNEKGCLLCKYVINLFVSPVIMQSGIYIAYFLRSKILLAVHTRVARDHSKPTQEEGKSPVPFCDSRLPRKKKRKKILG